MKILNTCFSIMPFHTDFNPIDKIIESAAKECELDYVRGDREKRSGHVLPQLIEAIRDATVIVADITGPNANVFYELGIAHELRGPERVVIIMKEEDQPPFDVRSFRRIDYADNPAGHELLRKKLMESMDAAINAPTDKVNWSVIRGRLARTLLIVDDLKRLVTNAGTLGLKGTTIRINAGLGSLAISDRELELPDRDETYLKALIEERDWLRTALLQGARLKAVLIPPRRLAQAMDPKRLCTRYERLIGLLEGRSDIKDEKMAAKDVAAMEQCEFVLTPVPMSNLFIIGTNVAYEGMKRRGAGGFEMTHCETRKDAVCEMIKDFDALFEDSRDDMIRTHPPDGCFAEQLRAFHREATSPRVPG